MVKFHRSDRLSTKLVNRVLINITKAMQLDYGGVIESRFWPWESTTCFKPPYLPPHGETGGNSGCGFVEQLSTELMLTRLAWRLDEQHFSENVVTVLQ